MDEEIGVTLSDGEVRVVLAALEEQMDVWNARAEGGIADEEYRLDALVAKQVADKLGPAPVTKGRPDVGTTEWLLWFIEQKTRKMVEIARAKNADYAGASSDPFGNFRHVEDLGIARTGQGFLTRMTDKLCRVATFEQKGALEVKDETVEDTLLDLANYSLLLAAWFAYLRSEDRP